MTALPAAAPASAAHCELCAREGGVPVWRDEAWRVIRVDDASFPAFYRVVAKTHVAEFSDLPHAGRLRCMALVAAVETVLREHLRPTKVNLAALGNVVPHLHWHVVARFDWDSHFPQPIWGAAQRTPSTSAESRLAVGLPELDAHMALALRAL